MKQSLQDPKWQRTQMKLKNMEETYHMQELGEGDVPMWWEKVQLRIIIGKVRLRLMCIYKGLLMHGKEKSVTSDS